ncbi:DUF4340 domain-containing protein [uncultured Ferrovibrio sp.]|uniref:DUF4340 domain-containing protein n=1 Tax=uncultured Ferrovibrio sp. TaxID=1576913 RepID=UPI00260B89A6|nr:DUF4340 domain-containing protein [uncultured Ferrovibrio sp.]
MRNKGWAVLLASAVVLGGLGWWVAASRDSATQADFTPKPLFPGLTAKVNDIASLEIATSKALFRIERNGDQWTMSSRGDYPVRAELVRKNAIGIAGLETVEPRTDKPEHYDRLQVSEPDQYKPFDEAAKSDPGPILVRLVDGEAKPMAAVIVGKIKSYPVGGKPGQYHVRKPGEARAWLAQGILELPADPVQWLVKDVVKVDRARVAEAVVTYPDGEVLKLVRAPKKDAESSSVDFTPAEMPKGMKIASQYDVNAVPGLLAWLTFDDVAKAEGKDFSKATVVEITTLDGVRVVVRAIPDEQNDKKAWARFEVAFDPALVKKDVEQKDLLAPEEAEKQAKEAQARVDGWAYLLPESTVRDMNRRLKDLIEPEKKDDEKKEG